MIRITKELLAAGTGGPLRIVDGYCISGDTKPTTGMATGSKLTEVDTGLTYLYDEVGQTWNQYPPAADET